MKVLVTGARGFVGRAMIAHLQAQKDMVPVAGVRRLPDEAPLGVEHMAMGDLDPAAPTPFSLSGIDCIIHCAARVHVMQESAADALSLYRRINTQGTTLLAQKAADAGVSRFVFLSSIKVNGEQTENGQKFTPDDTFVPSDLYGQSKWEAEQALLEIAKSSGMEIVIVRPPLVYGPEVRANFLAMMGWLKKSIPLPLADTGNMRSLVGIDNLTAFLTTCATHPKAANQIFLVSDNEDVSTSTLLTKLAHHLSTPKRLFPAPRSLMKYAAQLVGRAGIYDRLFGSLQLDTSKNQSLLGWTPPKSLDAGLAATAKWFEETRT